ncbi:MAG: Secretion system C-terminal sorting domain [Bacteroidota bacterium]|jgi:hypothetical protein
MSYSTNYSFLLLCCLLLPVGGNAQASGVTDPCPLYGTNYSKIVCRYDTKGNRIFRGFDCIGAVGDSLHSPTHNRLSAPKTEAITTWAIAKVAVSPNPTNAVFTVQFETQPPNGTIVYVTDSQGKLLHEEPAAGNSTMTFSLSSMPTGTYFLALVQADGSVLWRGKVIKAE